MSEQVPYDAKVIIPQETLLLRLEQAEELREFAIQMWLQNPLLAQQAGDKVKELLAPVQRSALS
ncbi:MAG: hypothetical protein ACOY6N_12920 [Pseudomonadota bacterium]|jgi:hypothetical protein